MNIQVTSSGPLSTDCSDNYMFGSTCTLELFTTIQSTKKPTTVVTDYSYTLPEDVTAAELYDVNTKGIRVFRYLHDKVEIISNLLRTVEMFIPEGTLGVPQPVAEANIDFLNKYSHIDIQPRDASENIPPAENEIHSGDSFYIMRFDGLNPMLAWAMGSTTGHVTTGE